MNISIKAMRECHPMAILGCMPVKPKNELFPMEQIAKEIWEEFNISLDEIRSRSRIRSLVEARHLFCYFASQREHTCTAIGKFIRRDHSSVLHAKINVINLCKFNHEFKKKFDRLINRF